MDFRIFVGFCCCRNERFENPMSKSAHNYFGIFNEFFQLTFFFFRDIAWGWIVTVFNFIAFGFFCKTVKTMFEITDFRGTEGIIGSCENNGFGPIILSAPVLQQSIKKTFPVFTSTCLSDIYDVLTCFVRSSEKKVDTALLEIFSFFVPIEFRSRNFVGYAGPIGKSAFAPSFFPGSPSSKNKRILFPLLRD